MVIKQNDYIRHNTTLPPMQARTFFFPRARHNRVWGQSCRGSGCVTSDFTVAASKEQQGQEMKRVILCPCILLRRVGQLHHLRRFEWTTVLKVWKEGVFRLVWNDWIIIKIYKRHQIAQWDKDKMSVFLLSKVYICSALQWGQSLFESPLNLPPFLYFPSVCVCLCGNQGHLWSVIKPLSKPWLKRHHPSATTESRVTNRVM